MTTILVSIMSIAVARATPFTDRALARTLATQCAGSKRCIFYLWSPNMPIATKGLTEALAFAPCAHLRVVPLVDPNANTALTETVRKQWGWPREVSTPIAAETLYRRGAGVHFPSYVFATKGRLTGHLVPGYRTHAQLSKLVAHDFK